MARYSRTVRSLLVSSLGLPGLQDLVAGEPPEDGFDYRFTRYDEEPLPLDKLAFGDPRRYEIDSHQFRLIKTMDNDLTLELGFLHEAMSGSSPWYALPGPDGPLQVMSGATIREERNQVDAALGWNHGRNRHRVAAGYSSENDYRALYGSYGGEREAGGGLRTWSWGASYSDDELEPSDALAFGRVPHARRDSASLSGGLTQVLNRNSVVQTGLTLTRQSGYLSDPYKRVWVDRAVLNDSRPDERLLMAWTTRLRQYLERFGAALQADARLYRDDWDITSLTLETAWQQPLGQGWELTPSIRYYSQGAPGFYAPYFAAAPSDFLWSSDYRLATYGALSYRLAAGYRAENWHASLRAEYYDSSESLALFGSPENTPGLVDFWRLTFGFTVRL